MPPSGQCGAGDAGFVTDAEGFTLLREGRRGPGMIKTVLAYLREDPAEIEEAAYSTGLVRDVVALGVPDSQLGQRIVLVVTPVGSDFEVKALIGALRQLLPLYMSVEAAVRVRAELHRSNGKLDRRLDQGRGARIEAGRTHSALRRTVDGELRVGGMGLSRLAARVGSTPFFAYDRSLLDRRVAQLREALPAAVELSFAMKAAMPAVVQHLAQQVDRIDVASYERVSSRSGHDYCR